jgi:hypothetical protein
VRGWTEGGVPSDRRDVVKPMKAQQIWYCRVGTGAYTGSSVLGAHSDQAVKMTTWLVLMSQVGIIVSQIDSG